MSEENSTDNTASTDSWGAVVQRHYGYTLEEAEATVRGEAQAQTRVAESKALRASEADESDSDISELVSWMAPPPSFDEIIHPAPAPTRKDQRKARKRTRRQRVWRALALMLGWVLLLSLIGGGGYLVYRGLNDAQVEQVMPLPETTYHDAEVSQEPVRLTSDLLIREWPVVNADSDQGSNTWDINTEKYRIKTMSIKRMVPGSVFIPKVGIYAEVRGSDHFGPSDYRDFQTLDIPKNVHRGVWYSAGAPLTGTDLKVLTGQRSGATTEAVTETTAETTLPVAPETPQSATPEPSLSPSDQTNPLNPTSAPPSTVLPPQVDPNSQGTTLIASHVSWTRRHRGAFYTMSTDVKQGELIWVKGFDGSLSTWRVNGMWFAEHEAFPKEYLSATGRRRLVLTTCGGRTNRHGYYQQNVFTVAVPVPLEDAVNSVGG